MKKPSAATVKNKLLSIIAEMSQTPWLFAKNPERDFSRNRKLGFKDLLLLLLGMGGGSLQSELLEFTGYAPDTVTASAFVQQREKLLPFALEYILHEFTIPQISSKRYKGYHLLTIDGSDMHTQTNPLEPENYFQNHPGEKGYSLLHLNALYDLCNHVFVDALIQNRRAANEHKALVNLVNRSDLSGNVILLADRGYESYNTLAHIQQKGWHYLIRIKDFCKRSILSTLERPASPEFDIFLQKTFTRKQTKQVRENPAFHYLPTNAKFDFLASHESFYHMSFRIVRFQLPNGTFEVLITNLDQDDFPPNELKKLYHLRWGIETAFRSIKYAVGAVNFHSKKAECIAQELFAALILYNFSLLIASLAILPQGHTKHSYQLNISMVILLCRRFFRSRDPAHPPDVEALLLAYTLPVRKDRCFARNVRIRQAVCFNYRIT